MKTYAEKTDTESSEVVVLTQKTTNPIPKPKINTNPFIDSMEISSDDEISDSDDVIFVKQLDHTCASKPPCKPSTNRTSPAKVRHNTDYIKKTLNPVINSMKKAKVRSDQQKSIREVTVMCEQDVEEAFKKLNFVFGVDFGVSEKMFRKIRLNYSPDDEIKMNFQEDLKIQKDFIGFKRSILSCQEILFDISSSLVQVKSILTERQLNETVLKKEIETLKSISGKLYESWKEACEKVNFKKFETDTCQRYKDIEKMVFSAIYSLEKNIKQLKRKS